MPNKTPEQLARDDIDVLLRESGWTVQDKNKIDFSAGDGQAVREYQTDVGPADYVLFVDKKAVGVIEAKRRSTGHKITEVESQTEGYATARLKWVNNNAPLPFLYESTGVMTRFTDSRDPKPRSREVLAFYRPETLGDWLKQSDSMIRHVFAKQLTRAVEIARLPVGSTLGEDDIKKAQAELVSEVANVFTGDLIELIDGIRRDKEQKVDHENLDEVLRAEYGVRIRLKMRRS